MTGPAGSPAGSGGRRGARRRSERTRRTTSSTRLLCRIRRAGSPVSSDRRRRVPAPQAVPSTRVGAPSCSCVGCPSPCRRGADRTTDRDCGEWGWPPTAPRHRLDRERSPKHRTPDRALPPTTTPAGAIGTCPNTPAAAARKELTLRAGLAADVTRVCSGCCSGATSRTSTVSRRGGRENFSPRLPTAMSSTVPLSRGPCAESTWCSVPIRATSDRWPPPSIADSRWRAMVVEGGQFVDPCSSSVHACR